MDRYPNGMDHLAVDVYRADTLRHYCHRDNLAAVAPDPYRIAVVDAFLLSERLANFDVAGAAV